MKIGLVLSGGMAKGAYQIGALKAINELLGYEIIDYISASSVGALNAYSFATGQLDYAQGIWKSICKSDSRLLLRNLIRSNYLQMSIDRLCENKKPIEKHFYVSLFDINRKSLNYINLSGAEQSLLPLYLKASVALPLYNRSVRVNNELYYDGAMIDNIPVFPLVMHKLDYLICIYFDEHRYIFESSDFDNRIIKITFSSKSILSDSLVFKDESIDKMILDGYEKTQFILKSIFSDGLDNKEYIYKAIRYLNSDMKQKKTRITGDVLTSGLNKVTAMLTKRQIIN